MAGTIMTVLDLKLVYTSGTTTTTGETETISTMTAYKVTTPINGWNISAT